MTAKLIIGNTQCKVLNLYDEKILKEFDMQMSYQVQGHQFMKNNRGWDGRYRLYRSNSFPIGLLPVAEKILKINGAEYEVVDNRDLVEFGEPMVMTDEDFVPRDYQLEVVQEAVKRGSGIVRIATGGGKSATIAMIAARYNVKTVIYVIGIELLYQMKKTIEGLYGIECGLVGDGHCDTSKQITIATIWSAASAFDEKISILDSDLTNESSKKSKSIDKRAVRDVVRSCKLMILDECQYAASQTMQFLHKVSVSAKHRFLFSGTPWREQGDDILIEAVSGPKFYDMSASKLIQMGYLVRPEIHFLDTPPMRGPGKNYTEVYKNYIIENNERNLLIQKSTEKLISLGKKVLVLIVKRAHGDVLQERLSHLNVDYLDGRNKSDDRIASIEAMRQGELDVLIASKIFDQGIDIPELDALILAGSGKSSGRALQRIGRVIRSAEGKNNAIVVDFWDNVKYLRNHSEIRGRVYQSEPEFKIKLPWN